MTTQPFIIESTHLTDQTGGRQDKKERKESQENSTDLKTVQ